uniref:Uncharacterized protein n=1 Tax=Anguilla anguilla TaxID=7936 RepID=A0A0E9UVI1_ANGAN
MSPQVIYVGLLDSQYNSEAAFLNYYPRLWNILPSVFRGANSGGHF